MYCIACVEIDSRQRQPRKAGEFILLRIRDVKDILGDGRKGSLHTRRIIGFGIHAGIVNGEALCRMFKLAIRGVTTLPRYLSSDHDPLYRFHQWEANLRILGVGEIKTVPYVPWSHPFIERVIRDYST